MRRGMRRRRGPPGLPRAPRAGERPLPFATARFLPAVRTPRRTARRGLVTEPPRPGNDAGRRRGSTSSAPGCSSGPPSAA